MIEKQTPSEEERTFVALKYGIPTDIDFETAERLRSSIPRAVNMVRAHRQTQYQEAWGSGPNWKEFWRTTIIDVLVQYENDPDSIVLEATRISSGMMRI